MRERVRSLRKERVRGLRDSIWDLRKERLRDLEGRE